MMSPGNWASEEYCRSVAASLVKAVYVLEMERGSGHVNKEMIAQGSLASGWWVPFNFVLAQRISDDRRGDGYIFGAVFEYRPELANVERHPSAPTHVVAVRGTIINGIRNARDLYDDMRVIFNDFSKMRRNHRTQQTAENVLSFREHLRHGRVWLAGHSLGATCAMLAGKSVARERGLCVPTFLFNPPHVSLLPGVITLVPDKAKAIGGITRARKAKVKVASLLRPGHRERIAQKFQPLVPWAPNMYLHDGDPISNGFVLDFEQRQAMAAAAGNGGGAGSHADASLGALTSIREMVCNKFDLQHLLPSAKMWINSGDAAAGSGSAHSLQQWWQQDAVLNLRSLQWSYEDNGQEAHC